MEENLATDEKLVPFAKKTKAKRMNRCKLKIVTYLFLEQAKDGPGGFLRGVSLKKMTMDIGYGGPAGDIEKLDNQEERLHYNRLAVDLMDLVESGVVTKLKHGQYGLHKGLFSYLYERTRGDRELLNIPALSKILEKKGV